MSRIRIALAAAAVAAAAVLTIATPASAHDALVSSSPAADEQLTTAPDEIVLTFSNDLLTQEENSGTDMTVTDSSGVDWVGGDPVVQADTVTVPLRAGMPDDEFLVTWRVVSSDGHPTDGEYSFSLTAVETAEPTPAETSAAATPGAEPSTQPSAVPTESATPAAQEDGFAWPLIIGPIIAVLAGVVAAIVIANRRKR